MQGYTSAAAGALCDREHRLVTTQAECDVAAARVGNTDNVADTINSLSHPAGCW